jgi:hypothetical protein
MTDIVERLRGDIPERVIEDHWTFDFDALDAQRAEAADEIERLRTAVSLAVYELNFVAAEHDCEQCATVAQNIASVSRATLEGK